MPTNNHTQPIILFDGVCNLCNASVRFVIKRDKTNYFKFAPLQTSFAKSRLSKHAIDPLIINNIVLIEGERAYIESTAALRIYKHLNGLWPLLYGFIIVPLFIRNKVYDIIANNRYKWFGKMDKCMVPSIELKDKFIETNKAI